MKNKLKSLFLILAFLVILPGVTFLAGCGATPSGKITGVKFETLKYDEATGYALFEVDQGVTTSLSYKVFPSSARGYKVRFDPWYKGTSDNSSRFTFENGEITVNSKSFQDVTYRIRIDGYGYTDTCIIRLKEYPDEILSDTYDFVSPGKYSVNVSSYETQAINIRAKFRDSSEVVSYKNITENDFDFLVETSDETVVNIPNPHRLKFCAVRNGNSDATVTVTLLNGQGEKTDLKFEIDVHVTQNAEKAFVFISGNNNIIDSEETAPVAIDYSELESVGSSKIISFDIYTLNSVNVLMESNCNYAVQPASKTFANVSADGRAIILSNEVTNGYQLKIKICTDLTMLDGNLFTIELTLMISR